MISPKMFICLRNHLLDPKEILAYGNIMNKKQIFTLVTLCDLQMTFVNEKPNGSYFQI